MSRLIPTIFTLTLVGCSSASPKQGGKPAPSAEVAALEAALSTVTLEISGMT